MVPVTSQASLYPDSEQAAELSDFQSGQESIRSREAVHPSRPSSRLDFNRTILSPTSSEVHPDSGAVQWSHSLFQSLGISNLRLSSIKPHPQAKADTMEPATLMPVATGEKCDRLNSNDHSTSISTYNSVPHDCIGSQVAPRKSPKTSPPPVSRLCFPFVTTSPRRNKPPPPPPTRHKYSCFPSLMSPSSTGRPLPKHQRHNYRQHGYSRLALQQIKWFWSTREEDWEGYNMYHHDVLPYEGVPSKGNLSLPPSHPSAPRMLRTSISPEILPPMTIHPRRGDISALRDPYCMHIDRCFADVPTWTISKTLWMHELHMAVDERNADARHTPQEDFSDAESESELEMSVSTGFSDDSDATLVESESETDLPNLLANKLDIKAKDQSEQGRMLEAGSSSTAISQSFFNSSGHTLDIGHWFRSVNLVHTKAPSGFAGRTKSGRLTNWYRRWELLMELSRGDRNRRHLFSETVAPPLDIGPRVNNTRRFFLGHKETEADEDDAWNARLEDIGV
ncbi:hypothetical protein CVT25_013542 [Psilocybe cyanescens]|uniref:Uncharacterized protein n=1 Tax=Psilocybe cyanescens TaxID=93625 RepID=A0A409XSP7_PSICY|nr:hypothetical protein CVT25_013542 [Psilocybe cyanescens]